MQKELEEGKIEREREKYIEDLMDQELEKYIEDLMDQELDPEGEEDLIAAGCSHMTEQDR